MSCRQRREKNPCKFQCFICAKNIRLQPSEKKNRLRRFVLRFYAILFSKIFQHQHTPRPTMFFFLFVGFVYIENFVPSPHLIVRLREIPPKLRKETLVALNCNKGSTSTKGWSENTEIYTFHPRIFWKFLVPIVFPSTHNFSPPSFGCYQLLKNEKKKRNTTIPSKRVLRNPPVTSPQQTNLKQKRTQCTTEF